MASVSGWDTAENWTEESSKLWYIGSQTIDPSRIFLSDTEYIEAEDKASVNSTYRWWYDSGNDRIYVYTTGNPASFYSDIESPRISDWRMIRISFKDYITLENLDVRAGVVGRFPAIGG